MGSGTSSQRNKQQEFPLRNKKKSRISPEAFVLAPPKITQHEQGDANKKGKGISQSVPILPSIRATNSNKASEMSGGRTSPTLLAPNNNNNNNNTSMKFPSLANNSGLIETSSIIAKNTKISEHLLLQYSPSSPIQSEDDTPQRRHSSSPNTFSSPYLLNKPKKFFSPTLQPLKEDDMISSEFDFIVEKEKTISSLPVSPTHNSLREAEITISTSSGFLQIPIPSRKSIEQGNPSQFDQLIEQRKAKEKAKKIIQDASRRNLSSSPLSIVPLERAKDKQNSHEKDITPLILITEFIPKEYLQKPLNQITSEDKLTVRMVFSELAKLTIGDVDDIMINTPKATLPKVFLQRYGTGINIIDQQHKLLWEMIIQISVLQGNAFAFSREILLGLNDYAVLHSEFEEKLMERFGVPFCEDHKKDHIIFKNTIRNTIEELNGWTDVITLSSKLVQFVSFLLYWLDHHVAGSDRKMCDWLIDHKIFQRG